MRRPGDESSVAADGVESQLSTSSVQVSHRSVPPLVRIVGLLAVLGLIGFAVWLLQGGFTSADRVPRPGSTAPNFTLQDTRGRSVSLADYHGKTVLLNFWATWCPPCRSEMPAIDAVARSHPNVVVLAVDLQEGPLPVQDFVQTLGLSFSPLLDTSGAVTALYHVDSLPSSFVIGPDGTIRAIHVGAMDERTLESALRKAS